MARNQRKYDLEYKIQALKRSKEIGSSKAAAESRWILCTAGYRQRKQDVWISGNRPPKGRLAHSPPSMREYSQPEKTH